LKIVSLSYDIKHSNKKHTSLSMSFMNSEWFVGYIGIDKFHCFNVDLKTALENLIKRMNIDENNN